MTRIRPITQKTTGSRAAERLGSVGCGYWVAVLFGKEEK
jgi:hypothetical protein